MKYYHLNYQMSFSEGILQSFVISSENHKTYNLDPSPISHRHHNTLIDNKLREQRPKTTANNPEQVSDKIYVDLSYSVEGGTCWSTYIVQLVPNTQYQWGNFTLIILAHSGLWGAPSSQLQRVIPQTQKKDRQRVYLLQLIITFYFQSIKFIG